jgi:type IV fimbrial biogenesis protein FimT
MQRQSGLTLVELMVVLAIIVILVAIGMPAYTNITNSYRMSSEINSLLGDLQYARGEALREGQYVTVCVANAAATHCSGLSTWQNGWIVFSNPVPTNTVPAAGTILHVQPAFTGAHPDTFTASNNITAISYSREGFANTAAGFASTLITLHNQPTPSTGYTRCLWITSQGTASIQTNTNNFSGFACN